MSICQNIPELVELAPSGVDPQGFRARSLKKCLPPKYKLKAFQGVYSVRTVGELLLHFC